MDKEENASFTLIKEKAHIVNHHLPEEKNHKYLEQLEKEDIETFLDDLDHLNDLVIPIISTHHVQEDIIYLQAEVPDHQRTHYQLLSPQFLLHYFSRHIANFHQHFDALERPAEPQKEAFECTVEQLIDLKIEVVVLHIRK